MGVLTRRGRNVDRKMIRRVGRPTLWEMAHPCPSINDEGQHDYTCTTCTKQGDRSYIYTIEKDDLRMIWMHDSRDEEFSMVGAWEKGEAIAVFPPHLPIGDQDRLTTRDLPFRDSMIIKRGGAGTTRDRIRTPHVAEILYVRTASTTYTKDTDYQLNFDAGTGLWYVEWLGGGSSPNADEHYTVMFMFYPTWIVDGHPKERAWGGGKKNHLLKTAKLKRYDASVVVDEDSD